MIREAILAPPALVMMADLSDGGLPDIDERGGARDARTGSCRYSPDRPSGRFSSCAPCWSSSRSSPCRSPRAAAGSSSHRIRSVHSSASCPLLTGAPHAAPPFEAEGPPKTCWHRSTPSAAGLPATRPRGEQPRS
jgi:hypothetical protein